MRLSAFIRYAALTLLILPLWGNAATISAGDAHTCALTSAGGVQCWGDNGYGQLGDGTYTPHLAPVAVSGLSSGIQAIAAGYLRSCALTTGGGVQCWGHNQYGQLGDGTNTQRLTPVAVSGLSSGVQALAVGQQNHTCALTTVGGVKCWGFNGNGQLGDGTTTQRLAPVAVSGLSSGVQAIATGGYHTCALTTTGGVQCWGNNQYGQLGDGTTTQRLTPVAVTGLSSGVQAIATGNYHTCALTTSGEVKCWGVNSTGQLGDGTTTQRLIPVAVSGLSNLQAIAVGQNHACALTATGAVQCWGYNDRGQLGDGTSGTNRLTPVAVSGLGSGAQAISAGYAHVCALMTAGGMQCWGYNNKGQLGDGTSGSNRLTPVAVQGFEQLITVTTAAPALGVIGVGFPVAATSNTGLPVTITASGGCSISGNTVTITSATPFCTVTYTQAGNEEYAATTVSSITSVDTDGDGTPNAADTDDDNDGVPDIFDAVPLDASDSLDTDVDGIGNTADTDDDNDTVLDGSDNCPLRTNLNQMDSDADGQGDTCEPPAISTGAAHTCVLTVAGGVRCWGSNGYGQIGDGTGVRQLAPAAVSGLSSGVQAITAGQYHTCALTTAGGVQCWGNNGNGQLGDGTTTMRLTPVAVSGLSSGVQAIAAGESHTCALTTAGGVKCWGYNWYGQLGDNSGERLTPVAVSGLSSGVQAIATGAYHTCALTNVGGVWCWGGNGDGQLGNGTQTLRWTLPAVVSGLSSGVQAIAAGAYRTCALTTAGGVQCWGNNTYGPLGDGTTTSRLTPVEVTGLSSGVQAITAGKYHSCALTTVGGAKCWGRGGALGDGTSTDRLTPIDVSGLSSGVQAIATGFDHTCALITSGGAQCWGDNYYGQLGDGTTTSSSTPVVLGRWGQVITVTTAMPALGVMGVGYAVAASSDTGLPVTITASGGCSISGNTVTITSATPFCTVTYTQAGNAEYAVTTISSITSVDTDGDGTANATDTDDDNDGVLDAFDAFPLDASETLDADFDGIGNAADIDDDNDTVLDGSDNCPLRANVNQLDSNTDGQGDVCEPLAIAAGEFHTCALTAVGGVQCWGSNGYGQLGDGTTTQRFVPVVVSGLGGTAQTIVAGYAHTCALTTAGGVQCWGRNQSAQLGDGTITNRLTPVVVSGLSSGVQAISSVGNHACALTTAGAVKCWGNNYEGQLGNGTTSPYSNSPNVVGGLSGVVQAIAAGSNHVCALMASGGVKCWGGNQGGQLGDGTKGTNRVAPVAVTGLSSGIQAITAGWGHTCALTTAGGVKCWGDNGYVQLGDGTTTQRLAPVAVSGLGSGVQAIAAGYRHTCALTTAGDVKCWGYNDKGQLGDGTTTSRWTPVAVSGLNNVVAIESGDSHTCALTAVGRLQCWGYNATGQLGDGSTTDRLTRVDVLRDGDGDGVLDASDPAPLDPTESVDTDHDGVGNNADADDDDDGIPDAIDPQLQWAPASVNGAYQGSSIQESAAPL